MAQGIKPIILGKDPLAVESLLAAFPTAAHTNPSIVAAFDMALLDILGQAAGLPLYKLLGGYRDTFETDITVGLNTPEKMAAKAQSHIDKGYKSIKVKVGQDPDLDFARLKAVREVIGPDRAMRIDANQGWTVTQAIYALHKMEPLKIQYAEQPVPASDTAGLKAVRQECEIGVMADEALFSPADALKLLKAEACDFFNIKLMKAGGIMNSLRIAHIAAAADMLCMVGCMLETKLGLTAAAHLVASQKNIVFADLDGNSEHTIDPFSGGMTVKDGMITLPEKSGLGVDIDPAFLKKLKRV
jgi:L-alanine-DL-glutamate epimerase-like enolase superfamily enzyme